MTVYAGAPVCAGAKGELARSGETGSVRIRVVCTEAVEAKGKLDLAQAGANARRAVEDSSTVGYIEEPGPSIPFTRTILEEASIALVTSSGARAMAKLTDAIESAGNSAGLREAVLDELAGGSSG